MARGDSTASDETGDEGAPWFGHRDELPAWWPDAAHAVVLHRRHVVSTGDPATPEVYAAGDEVPLSVAAASWSAHSDRLAVVDADGNRLDTPHRNERNPNRPLSADALEAWRAARGMRTETRTVHVCDECGETFDSRGALNGHQSAHAPGTASGGDGSEPNDEAPTTGGESA